MDVGSDCAPKGVHFGVATDLNEHRFLLSHGTGDRVAENKTISIRTNFRIMRVKARTFSIPGIQGSGNLLSDVGNNGFIFFVWTIMYDRHAAVLLFFYYC